MFIHLYSSYIIYYYVLCITYNRHYIYYVHYIIFIQSSYIISKELNSIQNFFKVFVS